jgi:hypothetical protein
VFALVAGVFSAFALGFSQPPSVGVACLRPNVTTCGRIGIAVWLAHPARSVSATVQDQSIRLTPPGPGRRHPAYWSGYTHVSLGLPWRWFGTKPVRFVDLQLVIRYATRKATGTVRVRLRPGWG